MASVTSSHASKRHLQAAPDALKRTASRRTIPAGRYGLPCFPGRTRTTTPRPPDGTRVQIETTQWKSGALLSEPNHLILLKPDENGGIDSVHDGRGDIARKGTPVADDRGDTRIQGDCTAFRLRRAPLERIRCEAPQCRLAE